jgi:RND family efflux transporter MFP subunit
MRKYLIVAVLMVVALAGVAFYRNSGDQPSQAASGAPQAPTARGGRAGGGMGGPGGGAFARPPMTVELASVTRAALAERVMIVGNLIGAATVEVVPKVGGRLESVQVRLGDRVTRGRVIARVEDSELREQVKQAEASHEVAAASIRQREADLKFAETNLDRSRSLFTRQLLPKQTLDDADAKFQAAAAQVDLARAQYSQARARLDELKINLANTAIVSPVDGFVSRRNLDPGAFVSSNAPVVSVVDIHLVRLVANLIEKDLRRVSVGAPAQVDVDAFPGETFEGRIARIAPVLDPATRTAQMEVEVPNLDFRLKPGMYARVRLTIEERPDALVVPRNAVVDVEGKRGVFVAGSETARFQTIEVGIQDENRVEVRRGVSEGDKVVTTGAAALRDGDRILLAGPEPGRGPRPGGRPANGAGPNMSPAPGGPRGAPPGAGEGAPPGAERWRKRAGQ